MLIRVEAGNGGKDRDVMLSPKLAADRWHIRRRSHASPWLTWSSASPGHYVYSGELERTMIVARVKAGMNREG